MWRLVAEQLRPRWLPSFAVLASVPLSQIAAGVVRRSASPLGELGAIVAVVMVLFAAATVYLYLARDARQQRTALLKTLPSTDLDVALSRVATPAVQLLVLTAATLVPALGLGLVEPSAEELGTLLSLTAALLAVLQLELLGIELRPHVYRLPYGRQIYLVLAAALAAALAFTLARSLSRLPGASTLDKLIHLFQPATGAIAVGSAIGLAALTVVLFLHRESYVHC